MSNLERVRRLLLPIMVMLALALPVQASCIHDFTEMRQEPDCENNGFTWMECTLCGHRTDFVNLPPTGHTPGEWYVVKEPTCSREGIRISDCLVCGQQQTEPVPSLGHTYEPEVRHPTCTAGGYTRYNCQACTSYYIADYTDPLGHGYDHGVIIAQPTENTLGRIRFTCVRCSETYLMTYKFQDIDSRAYYFDPVMWAVNRGITSGTDETHFAPDSLCNRAQVVTFLWRAAGKPDPKSQTNPFSDVPTGSFYEKAVLWAFEAGITMGTDSTHFSPNGICSRAQVVTFLHRFRGSPEPNASAGFPDVSADSFYHKAVLWAAQREITLGMDGGLFRPELSCTRAQIVTFLYRDANNP